MENQFYAQLYYLAKIIIVIEKYIIFEEASFLLYLAIWLTSTILLKAHTHILLALYF